MSPSLATRTRAETGAAPKTTTQLSQRTATCRRHRVLDVHDEARKAAFRTQVGVSLLSCGPCVSLAVVDSPRPADPGRKSPHAATCHPGPFSDRTCESQMAVWRAGLPFRNWLPTGVLHVSLKASCCISCRTSLARPVVMVVLSVRCLPPGIETRRTSCVKKGFVHESRRR